jgi:hypothetical protein
MKHSPARAEAIAIADAHLNNVGMPTITEMQTALRDAADIIEANLVHGDVSVATLLALVNQCRKAIDDLPDAKSSAECWTEKTLTEWMPIATAPRDGTEVLVVPDNGYDRALFQDGFWFWSTPNADSTAAGPEPKGWKPLPINEMYVIYSPNESATSDGAGFWSNEDGWTTFSGATRFTSSEIGELKLPISTGQDAQWVPESQAEASYAEYELDRAGIDTLSPAVDHLVLDRKDTGKSETAPTTFPEDAGASLDIKTFEVTGFGFNGETDETDDRVFWVKAMKHEDVRLAIEGTGAVFFNQIDCDSDIDFTLPAQVNELRAALLKFAPGPSTAESETKPNKVPVFAWDSPHYGGDKTPTENFVMEVLDKRVSNGQLFIDVASQDGNVDNIMTLSLEITQLPGTEFDTQCAHLHFDSDNMAMSIFKQGDSYILRPETGVSIADVLLANGERAYLLK